MAFALHQPSTVVVGYARRGLADRPGRTQGFSLLEVLAAFTILAMSLGVLMNIFSSGLRNVVVGDAYAMAADLADAKLALVGAELPLENQAYSGEEAGFFWRVDIQPYVLDDFSVQPQTYRVLRVAASVTWEDLGRERSFTAATLRLAPPQY